MLTGMGLVNTEIEPPPLTRRERAHAQTRDEILAAAHDLVRNGEEINMRAVARAVGMTAPALYRYVDGQEDLLDQLGGRLYDELIEDLVRARDALDPDDLIPRLLAMVYAFRSWALAHRHEYGLLFASPLMSAAHTNTGCTHAAGQRFGAVFLEIFATLWEAGMIVPPDLDLVDPELLRMLETGAEDEFDLPVGLRYLHARQWIRLYGMVTLEAFGHLSWALEDSFGLFEAMLDDCGAELGFPDQAHAARDATRPARDG